jgi:putative transposase
MSHRGSTSSDVDCIRVSVSVCRRNADWSAIVAADFLTTEVWTARGLITYYTAFVIELQTRRVRVLGSTPHPDGALVEQAARGLVSEDDDVLRDGRMLLCDRDPKWTRAMEEVLRTAGVRVVRTLPAAPNCNAHAERFVRSSKRNAWIASCRSASGIFVD